MKFSAFLILVTSLLFSYDGFATIYKCKSSMTGEIEYKQTECSAQQRNVKYEAPSIMVDTNSMPGHSNFVGSDDGNKEQYGKTSPVNEDNNSFGSVEKNEVTPANLRKSSSDTYTTAGSNNTPRSDTGSSSSPERTISDIRSNQLGSLIALAALAAFFVILLMGLTNRVVVFYDYKDLIMSLCVYLLPLFSLLLANSLSPDNPPDNYSSFVENTVIGVGVIGAVICAAISIKTSIHHNGMLVGVVVGVFKTLASIMMLLFALGWISTYNDGKYKSLGQWFVMFIMLGIFGWVIRKLVNGEAVEFQAKVQEA